MRIFTVFLLTLILSLSAKADILFIGDSHSVGPFGSILHKKLHESRPDQLILTYAHSSSAAIHWMNTTPVMLSGGIHHQLSYQDLYLNHLPDWRIKQETLQLRSILENPIIHKEWEKKVPIRPNLSTVIIALGANDRAAVATPEGIRKPELEKRKKIIDEMISLIQEKGLKCIWLGPPSSKKGTRANEETTNQYLVESIKDRCAYLDGRKYYAQYCDQVHFSCPEGLPTARLWAQEAFEFVDMNI